MNALRPKSQDFSSASGGGGLALNPSPISFCQIRFKFRTSLQGHWLPSRHSSSCFRGDEFLCMDHCGVCWNLRVQSSHLFIFIGIKTLENFPSGSLSWAVSISSKYAAFIIPLLEQHSTHIHSTHAHTHAHAHPTTTTQVD